VCFSYNVVFIILTYIIPLMVMGVCYLQMRMKLWGEPTIGEDTPNLVKNS
jgi:tachykinin receptor 3